MAPALYEDPILSIYITGHNEVDYISDCILSVIENKLYFQEKCNKVVEILVILDNSDSILENILKPYNKFIDRLIRVNTADIGRNRNIAIDNCRGEFIANIDADDLMSSNWTQECYEFMLDNEISEAILHPELAFIKGVTNRYHFMNFNYHENRLKEFIRIENPWVSPFFTTKAVLKSYKFRTKNESNRHLGFEDWEFFKRTVDGNLKHFYVPNTSVIINSKIDSLSKREQLTGLRPF